MGLLGKLLGVGRSAPDPDLDAAVGRAVDRIEPMLRQLGGYPERYREPVAHALAYARTLAHRIPGPVTVSRAAYASDPLVHALFASPDEVRATLCVSRSMRAFRQDNPAATEVYGLLCMRRGDKLLLGIELEGDVLRRDVPQRALYFNSHTLADTGRTEPEAREQIALGLFDSLLAHVAARIDARKQERACLEQRRDECLARRRRNQGTEASADDLDEVLGRLAALTAELDLRRYADYFAEVLMAPERHVFLERDTLVLDRMGVMHAEPAGGDAEVEFCELVGRDRRRWTVLMMRCDQLQAESTIGDRLVTAQRWLGL